MRRTWPVSGSAGSAWPSRPARTSLIHWSCWYSWLISAVSRQVATMVSWVGALTLPAAMSPMRAWTRSATVSRKAESRRTEGRAPRNCSGSAESIRPSRAGVGAGFGRGEVAYHEVSDVGLVAQMPADGTGVLVRAPGHLLRGEVLPQFVGVGAGTVVLAQQCFDLVHDYSTC